MKLPASLCATLILPFCAASAQTPAPEAAKSAEAAQIETLAKKIDEQNTKIDALSQEILKLEQQISHIRPGIMIGESTPYRRILPLQRHLRYIPPQRATRISSRAGRHLRPSLKCTRSPSTNCKKPITSKTAVSCKPAKPFQFQRPPRRRHRLPLPFPPTRETRVL